MQKRLYFLIATLMLMVSSVVAQVTTSGLSGRVSADGELQVVKKSLARPLRPCMCLQELFTNQ